MNTIQQIKTIFGEDPRLEDVFRVVKEKLGNDFESRINIEKLMLFSRSKLTTIIPYNPTLQLLEQPESTLLELLKLFK